MGLLTEAKGSNIDHWVSKAVQKSFSRQREHYIGTQSCSESLIPVPTAEWNSYRDVAARRRTSAMRFSGHNPRTCFVSPCILTLDTSARTLHTLASETCAATFSRPHLPHSGSLCLSLFAPNDICGLAGGRNTAKLAQLRLSCSVSVANDNQNERWAHFNWF